MMQTTAYIVIGTNVMKNVAMDAELVPVVTFNTDVEVALSRADPTLGSVVFCGGDGQ